MPAEPESGQVDLGGFSLEYVRFPKPNQSAPSLVMLHEGLGSVAMWRDFPARVAASTGAEVIAYSRRGYGQSSPRTESYSVDYMHEEARETLPQLFNAWDLDQPILLGHSDGASIALIQAAEIDTRVRALAVMAPHIIVEPISVSSIEEAKEAFLTTDLKDKLGRYHSDPEIAFWGWNDVWLLDDFLKWDIRPLLGDIECPVLAIQGEDDAYGTMAQIDGIEGKTSGPVELLKLPECGHSPHRDQPDAVLSAITLFVEKHQ